MSDKTNDPEPKTFRPSTPSSAATLHSSRPDAPDAGRFPADVPAAVREELLCRREEIDYLQLELEKLSQRNQQLQQAVTQIPALQALVSQLQEANGNLLKSRLDLSHLAHHDFLTNLPNRVQLNDRLVLATALALRNNRKLAVLFLDLDRFKNINDSLGHAVGDKLLQIVAERLRQNVRNSDTVSRQGGDEFIILLSEIEDDTDAATIAQKILDALAQPYQIDQHTLHISASMGISIYPTDAIHAGILIKHADVAMYQAKELGRNQYQFFKHKMVERVVARQEIENGLRHALEHHEFALAYQPKIRLGDGVLTGIEALLRWRHPQRGWLMPDEFIPIAEASRLILPMGQWALGAACAQARAWQDAGLLDGSRIAVNISAIEFHAADFVDKLQHILQGTGLAPAQLELELTESTLMDNAAATVSVLTALKALGVHLAIDDFGTGYSSLNYLQRFPTNVLKIDQSFISEAMHNPGTNKLLNAIINIGNTLQQTVIAEGIETVQQMALLKEFRCDEGQGFLISHPLPAAEMTTWLEQHGR